MIKIKPESLYLGEYHLGWVTYFAVVHLFGLSAVYYGVVYFSWAVVAITVFAVVQYFLTHLAITMAAHRYYAHRSYQAKAWFHYVNVLNFSAAFQGPILAWAARHLFHHAMTDQPGLDPHTPKEGFWHAHCLWVMKSRGLAPPPVRYFHSFIKRPEQYTAGIWQSRNHWFLCTFMAFGLPTLVGVLLNFFLRGFSLDALLHGALGGFLIGGCLRLVFQYHYTWIVNSYGHRNHDVGGTVGSSADVEGSLNKPLAVVTTGESHHHGHHAKPWHYRIGRLPGQWDPGARVLEIMEYLGVCSNLVKERGREVDG